MQRTHMYTFSRKNQVKFIFFALRFFVAFNKYQTRSGTDSSVVCQLRVAIVPILKYKHVHNQD